MSPEERKLNPAFLFIILGVINLIYSPIVFYTLKDPNLFNNKTNFKLFVHELYLWLGMISLIIGLFYWYVSGKRNILGYNKKILRHFFLILPFMLALLVTPVMDTYFPNSTKIELLGTIVMFGIIFSAFAFLAGIIVFIINLVHISAAFLGTKR